jgi:hypothetical protein
MGRREKGSFWYWLSLFCVALAAVLTGYLFGLEKGLVEWEALLTKGRPSVIIRSEKVQKPPLVAKETFVIEEAQPIRHSDLEENCVQIEKNVLDVFRYLDKKDYIRKIDAELETLKIFRGLIRKLSSQPPIPAGEALDSFVITKNIFYFYRLLDDQEIRLLQEIIKNETDALEMNLDLFFKWFTTGNRCPDKKRIRPSIDTLYPYAGYLINSIGGRAYLFRRRVALRLLLSYYCLLIVHEADKNGKNSYGIDIFPQIVMLREEMSYYSDFYFQKAYIEKLDELSSYYLEKR